MFSEKPCSKPTTKHARGNRTMDGECSPTKEGCGVGTAEREREIICRNELSQPKQSPAVCNGDCLGAAQDVQFSEQRLDVALDGDFRDRQASTDQLVGLAFRQQPQNLHFAWSQFFSG